MLPLLNYNNLTSCSLRPGLSHRLPRQLAGWAELLDLELLGMESLQESLGRGSLGLAPRLLQLVLFHSCRFREE